jgi:hypothetical protein
VGVVAESRNEVERVPSERRRGRKSWITALAALLALVAAESLYRSARVAASGWAGARFVWAEDARVGSARAFYFARDFSVPHGAALSDARILVLGDEQYQVHLNGVWVGGGSYQPGEPADHYDVSGLLRPGLNRLVVEARSATGVGGVLAALYLHGEDRPLVASDESWRVLGHHVDGIVPGTYRIDEGAAAAVLGRPPWGRWRSPRPGPLRSAAPLEVREVWAASLEKVPAPRWRRTHALWRVDFGTEVEGYLELWSDLGSCGCPLRFFVTEEELVDYYAAPSAGAAVKAEHASKTLVQVPDAPRWRDVSPRRFRYVTLEAPDPPRAARVLLAAAPPWVAPRGPFALAPPPDS